MTIKSARLLFSLLIIFCVFFSPCYSRSTSVRGYYRKDGTYVRPHKRNIPDSPIETQSSYTSSKSTEPFTFASPKLTQPDIYVFFSPNGGCESALIELIKKATTSIDVACFSFSREDVANALLESQKKGVQVRLILDKQQNSQQWSQGNQLAKANIQVKTNIHSGLMHDKFLIVDKVHLATGSYNWSQSASTDNDENLVVFYYQPNPSSSFAIQFERMWNDTQRFAFFSPNVLANPPPTIQPKAEEFISDDSSSVYVTATGSKYHRKTCRYLKKSGAEIPKKDAELLGYSACKVCKP